MEQNSVSLKKFESTRSNNLNLVKFIAALFVIISHAYPLCKGAEYNDILSDLSRNSIAFGSLAVAIFFMSSGFFCNEKFVKEQRFEKISSQSFHKNISTIVVHIDCLYFSLWIVFFYIQFR